MLDVSGATLSSVVLGSNAKNAGIVTVTDTGSSAKTFDVTGFGNSALSINANGASNANYTVLADSSQTLLSLNLGTSTADTLSILGTTAIADTFFANKLGMETLSLTSSATFSTLTLGSNATTSGITTLIDASNSGKTIDISADTIGTSSTKLSISAGSGSDTVIVNTTQYATINGNDGSNILQLSNALTSSESGTTSAIGNVSYSNISTVQLANSNNTVALNLDNMIRKGVS